MHKQKQLDTLAKQMGKADLPLKETATTLVFGKGDPNAKVFFIGEAPGKNEDLQGLPFVGAAGKLLDELFLAAGFTRDEIYITSILKYRPPNNRPPKFDEIEAHTPFLVKQIEIIKPAIVLPMGNFAARFVLASFDLTGMSKVPPITAVHGTKHAIKAQHIFTAVPLYHPAAGLYSRKLVPAMIKDLKKVRGMV